jgi:hypothetical protein
MVADNDLSMNAYDNVNEILQGVTSSIRNNKIIIYLDPIDNNPQLIEITYSRGSNKKTVIKDYPEQNSVNHLIMKNVLLEIINIYPSESYGLILWSHATSWLPPNAVLRSFGVDNDDEMDIILLEQSLPIKFEFIIFDACMMGSIEVAYQLRNKTNYIISSPTDVLSTGYPYKLIVSNLFGGVDNLNNITELFFQYYNTMDGEYQSASISLIRTKNLSNLAEKTKFILTNNPLDKWNYNSHKVQNFDVGNVNITYDFIDFIYNNYPIEIVSEVQTILKDIVISKYHTPYFLNKFQIDEFCGLSCYIPNPYYTNINIYYKNLFWYSDSGFDTLF